MSSIPHILENEALYDEMYAVTTDLLDDDVKDILKVSEGRWEIEECFLSLGIYRYLEKELGSIFTYSTILNKLRSMNFADIQEQGFIPLYTHDKLTDALHKVCGFDTDFKFVTKKPNEVSLSLCCSKQLHTFILHIFIEKICLLPLFKMFLTLLKNLL